jgi:5-formyltetrahydrofolate cyclo-ligase
MDLGIGFSEVILLAILALLFFKPDQMGDVLKKWKALKGKYFKFKYDIEDQFTLAVQQGNHSMKAKQSEWIMNEIKKQDAFQKAKVVAAFYPLPNEPEIQPLLQEILSTKTLLLPRVFNETEMAFVKISDLNQELVKGTFGILEPISTLIPWNKSIDLFIVPGVRFSRDGGRIGHGKGYYDRFLSKYPHAYKIGVCFSSQIENKPLSLQPHDVKMNYIVAPDNSTKDLFI